MEEEKRYYLLHNEDWEDDIPFKLSKLEKDIIEWFLLAGHLDTDNIYFKSFSPEDWNEFDG